MSDIDEYAELAEVGFESKEPIAPEEEFFHAAYIAGQTRKNHINIVEEIDKLQIRGVQYNLQKVNIIITIAKQILTKTSRGPGNRENVECFSYMEGPGPWKGTAHAPCGQNSAARAADPYCNLCRAQIILAGIHCDENGKPITGEDRKPTFIFLRGKGMKYSGVSNYLNELFRMEFDPVFQPTSEEKRKFEKKHLNNKRFVTEVTIGEASSSFGPKKIFELKMGKSLPEKVALDVLKIAQKTLTQFNDKFNWSKRGVATGYTEVEEGQKMPESSESQSGDPVEDESAPFDFEGLKF